MQGSTQHATPVLVIRLLCLPSLVCVFQVTRCCAPRICVSGRPPATAQRLWARAPAKTYAIGGLPVRAAPLHCLTAGASLKATSRCRRRRRRRPVPLTAHTSHNGEAASVQHARPAPPHLHPCRPAAQPHCCCAPRRHLHLASVARPPLPRRPRRRRRRPRLRRRRRRRSPLQTRRCRSSRKRPLMAPVLCGRATGTRWCVRLGWGACMGCIDG